MTWEQFIALCVPQPRTITVQALTGSGGYGDVYADPVDVHLCVVDDTARVVAVQTQDAAGTNKTSSTQVYAPPDTVAPAGSLVTLPGGRTARVLASSRLDAHGLDLPEHVELDLE
ncbi:hypothetical protein [Actinoplanes sp. NPDC048796]|uniref:hypothetical protein n=1 Tax=Actinoplanes sp. NPDC048796 TaxID=3155640 RepID=UPI0033EF9EF3